MKSKIIDLIQQQNNIALVSIKNHIPEAAGEFDFYFPAKDIEHSNILLIAKVSKEFIDSFVELINQKVLTFEPTSLFVVAFDGGEIYNLPTVKKNKLEYKKPHFLPLLIKKGINF